MRPNMGNDEATVLRAFDDNRNAIHVAVVRAYKRERRGSYSGLPSFDGFVRCPAVHDYHREMGLSQFEREGLCRSV